MNDNEKYLEKLKTHRRHLHQIRRSIAIFQRQKNIFFLFWNQLDCELTFLCGSGICAWFYLGIRRYLRLPFRHGWTACDGSQHM